MKTMQLSVIALLFLSLFSACTKDNSLSADSTATSSDSRNTILGGRPGSNANQGPATPLLIPSQTANPVPVNVPVTVKLYSNRSKLTFGSNLRQSIYLPVD